LHLRTGGKRENINHDSALSNRDPNRGISTPWSSVKSCCNISRQSLFVPWFNNASSSTCFM